ncbi:MAG: 30S ribosomal protein S2 [Candidatus Colwellbacteria bacterium]|nr:30S ribosomal protein S2 [Candidatus Colwellbacteria bacterium]
MPETSETIELENNQEESLVNPEDAALFEEMMRAGVFYGRSKSRTNSAMKKYILTTRAGFEVIDLSETISSLKSAAEAIKKVLQARGKVLLVGTSPAVKTAVKILAEKFSLPYVTERWLGGTITNFKVINERVNYFKKLKDEEVKGEWDKYSKKEKIKFKRELDKLERLFAGISTLERLPALVFIADLAENDLAAKEAKQKGIPVAAFVNTDADPALVDYPVPANDRNIKSIEILLRELEPAFATRPQEPQEPTATNTEKNGNAS